MRLGLSAAWIERLRGDRGGVVGLFTASMTPVLFGVTALIVDAGVWTISQTRLQTAADAAAVATGFLLSNPSLKSQGTTGAKPTFQAVALAEVDSATGNRMIGTLQTPVGITIAADFSSVTVTLTARAQAYFIGAVGFSAPMLTATATAGLQAAPTCVLALATATSKAIKVDNAGTVRAVGCNIFSNSSASDSIYLDSGTINGAQVGTRGGFVKSNSGSNYVTPAVPTTYASAVPDPFAARVAPTPAACMFTNTSYSNYSPQPHTPPPGTYCGTTTFGGNGTTVNFAPGVYIFKNNGSDDKVIFNNATITGGNGVTFVMTGPTPPILVWTNYSNSNIPFTAPSTGATAGMVFWQTCGSVTTNTPRNSFAGGSTLVLSGAVYMPCGELHMTNNAKIAAPWNGSLSVVVRQIYSAGSAAITAQFATGGGSSNTVRLTN